MAVQKVAISTHRYTGLAADTKPTGVPAGSTFFATDTGFMFLTHDGTTWVRKDAVDYFGGAVYENQDTASADTARRFETLAKRLRDIVIQVATYAQMFGGSSNQRYRVEAGETIGFTKVDISTLYFKNATAGQNGIVRILAVEE